MGKEIKIGDAGDLQIYLETTLGACSLAIQEAAANAADQVGKEAVTKLKNTSPTHRKSKAYSKGWRYKVSKIQADGSFDIKIYNATYGSLTHLLENGHPIVSKKGTVVGRANPKVHIQPVNEWVQNEGFKRIANAVQDAIRNIKT